MTTVPLTAGQPMSTRYVRWLPNPRPPAPATAEIQAERVVHARYHHEPSSEARNLGLGAGFFTIVVLFIAAVFITPHLGFHTFEGRVPPDNVQIVQKRTTTTEPAAVTRTPSENDPCWVKNGSIWQYRC